MASRTLFEMFQQTVSRYPDRPAVGFKKPGDAEHTYLTFTELNARVGDFRRGLAALGLRRGDRLAILSENRVEWAIADLAAQAAGIINVAPYASLPAAQIAHIVRDSGARVLVLSDAKQRRKLADIRAAAPALEYVIGMDGTDEELAAHGIKPFEEVARAGADCGDGPFDAPSPNDVAMLIYTSGTTGDPKGAMLTHCNVLQTPDAVVEEPIADLGPEDRFLSFLPLSHITERVGGYYLPLRVGACIIFSQGLAHVGEELTSTVRPTAMLCVPRIFENIHGKFVDSLPKLPKKVRGKVEWGLKVGAETARRRSAGSPTGPLLGLKNLVAERLIYPKLREKLTGGNIRYFVSGGAPLNEDTATFFLGIGVQILEGYGLSETNIIAINRPGKQKIGTVGRLLPKVEVRIAEDGEILMRGEGLMMGYWEHPEATAEAIDSGGWFHTGDVGELSADGILRITDRKKDLIVLTNGKKVAPQPIEALLKRSPYIGEAVLFGDRQATVNALIVPVFEKLLGWAKEQGLPVSDIGCLTASPEVQKLYKSEIDAHMSDMADYERIKRFRVLSQPFGIESGELTPTLKVKRKFVGQKYAESLASMAR